jgi:hypothetical protein
MHGYFSAEKLLVLASVKLARHSKTYDFNEFCFPSPDQGEGRVGFL